MTPPAFADAADTWNRRFTADGFLFGTAPNGWLTAHAGVWQPGNRVLCVADGEGRNSVWLARQGLVVDAFDIAEVGVAKARRLAAGVPQTTAPRPFPLLDNTESLLDSTDLVFVNAVGSGRSQAIAPYRNRDFWSVDADAALFRDAIRRWLQIHGRQASPFFLYGESYGGPRTAVLARRLQEAGLWPAGLMLQSPALDYNSNCGVGGSRSIPCSGYLPSYAATAAWHRLSTPVPTELDAWLSAAREFATVSYAPALQSWLTTAAPAIDLWPTLAAWTGLPAVWWQQDFNLGPTRYRENLIPGRLTGRYDARMTAALGSALAAEGDPSSTWLGSSFAGAIDTYLRDTLRYRNASTYVLLSSAIEHWDFSHAGRTLPDTVPDLAAALAADPALRTRLFGHIRRCACSSSTACTTSPRLSTSPSPTWRASARIGSACTTTPAVT